MAALAEPHGAQLVPHCPLGPVALAARPRCAPPTAAGTSGGIRCDATRTAHSPSGEPGRLREPWATMDDEGRMPCRTSHENSITPRASHVAGGSRVRRQACVGYGQVEGIGHVPQGAGRQSW
ncbi:hypothetical protein [Streptomyces violaceusniger]|uniref:hypothetical protein n=1 Tax=Streptomyces violaceusniger TaxID=68280 RepID=UPI0031D82EDA